MATAMPNANINIPYSAFLDPTTGRPSVPWLQWLTNPTFITANLSSALPVTSGGTGLVAIPTNGQLLIGNGTGYSLNTLTASTGITVTNGLGTITVTNSLPDLTVVLTGAGTTVVTGTYPNFTITSNDAFVGTVTSVGGTGTVNGITLTGTVTTIGNLTLGGTLDLSSPPAIGGTTPAAGTFTTLTATGQVSLGGVAGVEGLRVLNTASAVNRLQAAGSLSSAAPVLSAQGSDTNIDITLTPKGTGRVNITTSIKPKVSSAANVTSPLAWDSTSFDQYAITALANALTINADANASPADGQKMLFRFKDNGTARALTWTTGSTNSFRAIGVTLPTTTVISKIVYVGCVYNSADTRWDAVAVSQEV
jgi:hypothetical protein